MNGRNDASSRLLTIDQVAERLNVSVVYVRRRLIFEQRIEYVKIGRHARIDEVELEAFIDAGRVSRPRAAPSNTLRCRWSVQTNQEAHPWLASGGPIQGPPPVPMGGPPRGPAIGTR
jgi:excisionase family DNA binding protein